MRAVARTFAKLAESGSAAYIPYVCAGDPDREFTVDLVGGLVRAGADIVELGLPFSDPIADGPAIQGAMARALSGGYRPADVFETVADIRSAGLDVPIVVMTYFNPVMRMGVGEFCARLSEAGGNAVLAVDLPLEESAQLDDEADTNGIDVIRLIAPNTDDGRIDRIMETATGFAYAVSVAGVTGERERLPPSAAELLGRLRDRSTVPVALGFGISTPQHVRQAAAAGAAGIVEGSALVRIYSQAPDEERALELVGEHARDMKAAAEGALKGGG